MEAVKQVIVIRHDLNMRLGKAIAQGAHAAMMFMLEGEELTKTEQRWFFEGICKICVRVDSEDELLGLIEKAKEMGIKAFPITDAGRTEFHGMPTLTCCAFGPDLVSNVDAITGSLKLL